MPAPSRRLAVVQVTRSRPEAVAYDALVQGLNARVAEVAGDVGWMVENIAAEDVGVEALLERTRDADAVVIMGGEDVAPRFYDGLADYEGRSPHREVADAGQIALVRRAVAEGTPLLGICRGAQIVNVALGGTLQQHIEGVGEHRNDAVEITAVMRDHDVRVAADSRLARVLGSTALVVRSAHHQAVDRPGAGLRVVAVAPDGVPEAVEHETAPITGVQWHPEDAAAARDQLPALLQALADECALREPVDAARVAAA
ncbi:gamma-glutamyl-gamma-aminobutyrate hydrolase family protein [Clavibacter zhangzhiyongii]|uniref:gamma-glutamyl-gamma-aminobutyrate hydrolase family protein n=1 Tax=Clavibacter zhangzhiyongii TaxID=2768071 RepID=UPI00195B685C|nr:gamma-glutamyl-gamma-aminobutyrate hydrolase family protein [Clavibacter zhangzhiyongii]MBM7025701.1 gamma-glutamyl-gamma-aminobutyrate hydrolase family protein [Clavibacter zhangzhiyongii]